MSGVTNYQCPVCGVVVSSGHVCAMSAIQARIDTLTAERDAARAEFAEWLDASRKALATHAEVVAERDEARRVRTRWLLGGHVPTRTRAGAGGGMRRWEYHCEAGSYDCVTLLGLLREIFSHRWWHWRRGDGWVD